MTESRVIVTGNGSDERLIVQLSLLSYPGRRPVVWLNTNKQTNKQTNKNNNKQTSKQKTCKALRAWPMAGDRRYINTVIIIIIIIPSLVTVTLILSEKMAMV